MFIYLLTGVNDGVTTIVHTHNKHKEYLHSKLQKFYNDEKRGNTTTKK